MRNICMIGTGYVGLVTGACLADFGNEVKCVDIDEKIIDMLKSGELPIYEPGLKEIVKNNIERGRLAFSVDIPEAVKSSEVIFIAVGTPSRPEGDVDLQYVMNVAHTVAENLNSYKVIVNKSTVAPGTGRKVAAVINDNKVTDHDIDVVSNPEFLREGSAVNDFMRPDRIVIGTNSEKARTVMRDIYSSLYIIETPVIETDVETAEMIKYASNAFLAVKISYINEIANLCDKTGADVHVVAKTMGLDGRISPKFLHPGPGFGGSCFPKDTLALSKLAAEYGVASEVVSAAIKANENQRGRMLENLKTLLPELEDKTVAILGLSFKPNTDDVRDSPALDVIRMLLEEGAVIRAYDPIANDNSERILPEIEYFEDSLTVCTGADAVMLMTEWNEFRQLDLDKIIEVMASPNMVDCRNIYDPEKMSAMGFNYVSVGRPT